MGWQKTRSSQLLFKLALYFHTIRYLKVVQILTRLWFKIYRPSADLSSAPLLSLPRSRYVLPIAAEQSLIAENTFRFLNVEACCVKAEDWLRRDVPKLWLYNLHYFDDLNAKNSNDRIVWHRSLLERWILENPPGVGDGWEPYPTSRRIVNWTKWALRGNPLSKACQYSLAVQVRWLEKRIEFHILGNHLLANAKALAFAGCYFTGGEGKRWLNRGIAIFNKQLVEQILEDGGHFELSPMYHAIVLEDLLDLINLFQASSMKIPQLWQETAYRMIRWQRGMVHPDGEVSFFNDSAFAIAPNLSQLVAYAESLGLDCSQSQLSDLEILESSGYVKASVGGLSLLCDCAAIGPDYLPGHAHADTLSFELSIDEQRVLVNSGTSVYGTDTERQRQRGTLAHNTVTVEGVDSSEVWDGFRVARRARAKLISANHDMSAGRTTIDASHDGYMRLEGKVTHRRRWILEHQSLWIYDELTGDFSNAEARFHVHPNVQVRAIGDREVELTWSKDERMTVAFEGAGEMSVCTSSWHPEFGKSLENQCIAVQFSGRCLTTKMNWTIS